MKKKKLSKIYEGMGFAEALIALMIAGVVGIVLMRISSSTLRELAQLDIQDAIAQQAVSASVDLQRIAIADLSKEGSKEFDKIEKIIPPAPLPDYQYPCYGISFDGLNIDDTNKGCVRGDYTEISGTGYFRIFHVLKITPQKAIVEIVTGVSNMAGEFTSSTDIKDYSYLVTIVR